MASHRSHAANLLGYKASMQTILGAGGPIAVGLAQALRRTHAVDLRLVGRQPKKVDQADVIFAADLLDARATATAVAGSEIVYFTAGLPPDTRLWERQFPVMLENALSASRLAGARFVYFDNTYMYPRDARVLDETTAFEPLGRKGRVRAAMATRVLEEMARGDIPVLIARAPEFYGPAKTQSFTNALIIDNLKAGKRARVPVRDDTRRTLIWTPDASRALALLGNTEGAFGQTWHLPCDDHRLTYREFVALASEALGREPSHTVLGKSMLWALGLVSRPARELRELLPRYAYDNLFDSSKFKGSFPDFRVTTYRDGIFQIFAESLPPNY
jgi:nucleoside-diphosphate-sugar epimerase